MLTRHATRATARSAPVAFTNFAANEGYSDHSSHANARALREILEAGGYRLNGKQFDAIMSGDAVPDRPIEFIAVVSAYFQLTQDEERALLFQVAYDILRPRLGRDGLASVFG
ncbi:MAG TPA: hypothetical protein VF120_15330 [Ktedonobacterales bacterium]